MAFLISLQILIPIILAVIVLAVLMWILYHKNKKMYSKLTSEKKRSFSFKEQLEYLKTSREGFEKDFQRLNKVARIFFKEYFNLAHSLTYLELAANFDKQNKKEHANFCRLMSDFSYKGEKVKTAEVRRLIDLLSAVIDKS
jgi:hypothetical protein